MSGNALPFVGHFYMHLIVFANTNKIHAFWRFSIQKNSLVKYIIEPNPGVGFSFLGSVL